MKVALLTREYPPEVYGGAGVHVEYLARELARLVDIGVFCFGEPRDSALVAAAYKPWAELPPDPRRSALGAMSVDLRMAVDVEGSDLVHSHTWYANLAGHLAKLLYGIPHVMTAHSLEPLRPWKAEQLGAGYALSSFCERTAIESADAVIAVSRAMRDDIGRAYPQVEQSRLHVIHNGIDPHEYQPDHATDVLERFGIDPNRASLMFVGRVTRQKGVVHLLDAIPDIDPAAQVILCAGAPDTPEIAAETRSGVARLQARRSGVFWIEQMLARQEIVQLLSHATVFVCPSVYEPFGLINVEAMACGVPVVATAVGGIPEVVVDAETGYLVSFDTAVPAGPLPPGAESPGGASTVPALAIPANPAQLAADLAGRINDLLADPEKAARFGRAGRRRVVDHFSWAAIAEQTARLYRQLSPTA